MQKRIALVLLLLVSSYTLTAQDENRSINKPAKTQREKQDTEAGFKKADSAAKEQSHENLARVAILTFLNSSHSKNHEWVSNSLSDAIELSMQARFEFARVDKNKVAQAEKSTAPKGPYYKPLEIEHISVRVQADMVIYGHYELTPKKDAILISAYIYNVPDKRIIGTAREESELNNQIFKAIDTIAEKIVGHIYRYALAAEAIGGPKGQDVKQEKKLRLLVLVPSYKIQEEESRAMRELESLKHEFNGKYEGEYITIFEYFDRFRVPDRDRERVMGWAKMRKQDEITAWLVNRGVQDAFVILIHNKKVAITPLVDAKVGPAIAYKAGITGKKRKEAMDKLVQAAKIQKNEQSLKQLQRLPCERPPLQRLIRTLCAS